MTNKTKTISGTTKQVEALNQEAPPRKKSLLSGTIQKTGENKPGSKESSALQKRAARLLSIENAERYRNILNNMNDGCFEVDLAGNFTFFNDSVCRVLGYSREELLGMNNQRYTDPENAKKVFQAYHQVYQTGKPLKSFGWQVTRKDGSKRYIEGAISLRKDSSGNPEGFLGIVNDLTERKIAEEARLASEEKFALAFRFSPSVIIILNLSEGRFVDVNDSFLKQLGYRRDEIIGRRASDLNLWVDSSQQKAIMQDIITFGKMSDLECQFRSKQGEIHWGILAAVIIDIAGNPCVLIQILDTTEKKRAEEKSQAEERRFRALAEQSSDIILLVNRETVIIYENQAVEKILGFKIEGRIGNKAFENVHPDDLNVVGDAFNQLFHEGTVPAQIKEVRIRDIDGNWHTFEFVASNLLTQKNIVEALVINLRDVTDRKKAEEALRQSEEKYRLLADHMKDQVWLMDLNLKLTYISPSTEKFMGYSLKELQATPLDKLITPATLQAATDFIAAELPKALAAPEDYYLSRFLELELVCKDGQTAWIEHAFSFIRDENGKPVCILGEGRNITDRKQAEEALKKTEERYRMVADNARDVIWTFDYNRDSSYVSPSVRFLRGYTSDDVLKQPLNQILTPESFNRFVEIFNRELLLEMSGQRHGADWSCATELEMFRKDGSTVWTEAIINFFYDEQGEPKGIMGITRDITERKQAEEERNILQERLQRAEKMEALGTLAGGVAHDLNNVLGILVGYSELLAEKLPQESPLKRYADNILKSSLRGTAIVEDLLTLARRGVTVSEVVNLNRVVFDYLLTPEFEKLKLGHPGVNIRTDLEKGLLNIKGSPVHLGKTIMNLVLNAIESLSGQGEVSLRAENRYLDHPVRGYDEIKEGDYVVLTVSDTGNGISAKDLTKIFEPFYTKKVMGKSGTGLGLAVVWGTVKDHNGYIDVQSEEGRGSIFTLYFPATRDELDDAQSSISSDAYLGRGESILVVDDVQAQRELAVSMLERLGYRVEAVAGGEEAVQYLKNKKADLVVLDMIMEPGIDGMETYRRLCAINPGQKAVIVSGFSETDRVSQAQKMGAGAFVRKPYILEKIGLAIRKELDLK